MELKHIAFIMDGNRRWARRRGLPVRVGHAEGAQALKRVIKHCAIRGIEVVSIFAFSTENWKRSEEEKNNFFDIVRDNIDDITPLCMEYSIRVVSSGDTTKFPQDLQDSLARIKDTTKGNDKCVLNLCVNYGGRDDIVYAVNKVKNRPITEKDISANLYTSDLSEPDLIVRTSGELRVSNFMLWQMAYSELYFVKKHWPSMNSKLVDKCIKEFGKRKRRRGK